MDRFWRFYDVAKPYLFALLASFVVLGLLASAVFLAVYIRRQESQKEELRRVTQIIEGTPGPQGEPGIGVHSVVCLPVGSCEATLQQQRLTLRVDLPEGPRGPRGFRGARGNDGNRGAKGEKGDRGERGFTGGEGKPGKPNDAQIAALINAFFRSHTFTCTRISGQTWTCRVIGARRAR